MNRRFSSLLTEDAWTAIGRSLGLSTRELQIVTMLIEDRIETEDQIAHILGISSHTVHTHLERLYKKIGVTSRCHLILRVFAEYVQLHPLEPQTA
jgi:DNA-binding CsgD family transcriptional regulator